MKNVRTPQGGIFFDSHCRIAPLSKRTAQAETGSVRDSWSPCEKLAIESFYSPAFFDFVERSFDFVAGAGEH